MIHIFNSAELASMADDVALRCLGCGREFRRPPGTDLTCDADYYQRQNDRCDGRGVGQPVADSPPVQRPDPPYAVTVQGWGRTDPADVAAVVYASLLAAGDSPTVCIQTRADEPDRATVAIVVSRHAIGPAVAVVPTGPLSPPISFGESIVLLSRIRACGEQLARTLSPRDDPGKPRRAEKT